MILKPQDIVIALKIISMHDRKWTYALLAYELFMSPSEVHAGVKRSIAARIIDPHSKAPLLRALEEFLIHGIKYAFPAIRGGETRGIPTSYAAPPLVNLIAQSESVPLVWPDPEGNVRGYELSPLYKNVPKAVSIDKRLYELLVLIDAIRDVGKREKSIAIEELIKRLRNG